MKGVVFAALAVLGFLSGCGDEAVKDEVKKHIGSVDKHSKDNTNEKQLVQVGPRPYYLIDRVQDKKLRKKLESCKNKPLKASDFSIGHRGAAMQFPEHSKESYEAAARMGAGILECDVTFTKDKELVCRHSQCDLHATTDIVLSPLAQKCTVPPIVTASGELTNAADIKCCTSDITVAEFKTLHAKMDAANKQATTLDEYVNATPAFRTDRYSDRATLMTHKESIELFKKLGVKMTPELKTPSVDMPFDGMSQEDYAQKMVDEYKCAHVNPKKVFAQSFNYSDILYWVKQTPKFGKQAVYLDGRAYGETAQDRELFPDFDQNDAATWAGRTMKDIKADGVNYVAPPMWVLVKLDDSNNIVPSLYAKKAKKADLGIITWTLERSGLIANNGGGWYYQTTTAAIDSEGDAYELLDVLAKDVKIDGIFSDWPGTVTYYSNCMNIK